MLKKTGIIVATAAAGLLTAGGLAFATTPHHDDEPDRVEYSNVEQGNLANDCEFGQAGPQIAQDLTGGDSLAGVAGLVTGAVAPVTTQTQALNCTNIGVTDVIDSGSGNTTVTETETEIEDSNNSSTTLED